MFSLARYLRQMGMMATVKARKGRGAASNETGRFERGERVAFDDGWNYAEEDPPPKVRKGRSAATNETGPVESRKPAAFDDAWNHAEEDPPPRLETRFDIDA